MAGLSGLQRLRLARRPFLTDAQLAPVLAANRRSLRTLELAGCASLTDAALLPLLSGATAAEQPAEAAPRPPPLEHLSLCCCDRVTGSSLRHLARLRTLRLGGCPAVDEAALQAAAICCTQLTLLELPGHIAAGSVPIAGAASHLRGLALAGGSGGGGRWG